MHPGFGRALLGLLGIIPVGSHVLEDGRLALVVAAGERGDPLRPRVLVGGEIRAAGATGRAALAAGHDAVGEMSARSGRRGREAACDKPARARLAICGA